jgi:DNA-directed RNA polymerase specialized sigma subunit
MKITSLCVYILKKFDNTGEDMEDLFSIGTIGLIKAIESIARTREQSWRLLPHSV